MQTYTNCLMVLLELSHSIKAFLIKKIIVVTNPSGQYDMCTSFKVSPYLVSGNIP